MINTTHVERLAAVVLALTAGIGGALHTPAANAQESARMTQRQPAQHSLTAPQQAILPITAFAAVGDLTALAQALEQGLDAGLTVSDAREILVQLYAYAGFPRSLNALGTLKTVVEAREQRGVSDAPGREPQRAIPTGEALLAAGTRNQTQLVGAPVSGPLFDFAPAIDEYLKTHLFGDIFERDNLDWQARELATLGVLAALPGVAPQLQSHMAISMNVGLTADQLRSVATVLGERVDAQTGQRASQALERHLAAARAG